MIKHMQYIGKLLGTVVVLAVLLASCNLGGEGIFRSVSQATEMDDSELRETPVNSILGREDGYLLVEAKDYTEKGKLHGYDGNKWVTLDDDEDGNKKRIVFDGSTFYARGIGDYSNTIYSYDVSNGLEAGTVTWEKDDNFSADNDEIILVFGLIDGDVFVLYKDGDDLKMKKNGTTAEAANLLEEKEFVSATAAGSYLIISLIEEFDDDKEPEDHEYETMIFENDLDDNSPVTLSNKKVNGALFSSDKDILYITAFDGDDFFIMQADTTADPLSFIDRTDQADSFSLRRSGSTPMILLEGEDTILIGARRGLYAAELDNNGEITGIKRPDGDFYTDALHSTVVNGFFSDSSGYDFYIATRDFWVYRVESNEVGYSLGW